MLSRSSLSTCRSALVRAPTTTKHLLQVARESTTTAAAPEPPKEEAKPAPKKRSIPLATGFEDLFAAKPLAPAPPASRNAGPDGNRRPQQRDTGRGERQGVSQGRSYGAIDFMSLADDEFDGRLTGSLALRLQHHQKQVSKALEPKAPEPKTPRITGQLPMPGIDSGILTIEDAEDDEAPAPVGHVYPVPTLRPLVNFGAGKNTYEDLVLPKGVQKRIDHPERPQTAHARGQPRTGDVRQERRPRTEDARQERKPRTEDARQERRPRADVRFAGAANALMGSTARMQAQAQDGQQRQRRDTQPRTAATRTPNRQTRPRTTTTAKTPSNTQARPRRQSQPAEPALDDLAVQNFKYDVTFVAEDAEPQVMSPEALKTLFAQPVQAVQASMPLLKSLSTLPEPAVVITTSEPESKSESKETEKPAPIDRAQVRRALETIGGQYTRYAPVTVQHAARQTPTKAGPVLYAHLALARQSDLSLARRQHALELVRRLVAQADTAVVAQPQI
ncbi:hypothetical protein EIP86_007747 [Pleurotus ostreatoroseus]|nr:hypothetical protein EIP86_007747 [Pleurotus ostreatoroseus]